MRIGQYAYDKTVGIGNHVTIMGGSFTSNGALNGGGVFVSIALQRVSEDPLDVINILDVVFSQNVARLAWIRYSHEKFPFIFTGIQIGGVRVKGCTFTGNSMHYLTRLEKENSDPCQVGDGTVYVHGVSVSFDGNVTFLRNSGSGL